MKCKFPGCKKVPTRWSRHGYCGEHRGAAQTIHQQRRPAIQEPNSGCEIVQRLRAFRGLKESIEARFPQAGTPYARNASGYDVVVLVPGGLRA